jgi:hypothetical protein
LIFLQKYRIREHEAIFASADTEQVSHMSLAGDVNGGKAWKAVRRPSDMVNDCLPLLSLILTLHCSRMNIPSKLRNIGQWKSLGRRMARCLSEVSEIIIILSLRAIAHKLLMFSRRCSWLESAHTPASYSSHVYIKQRNTFCHHSRNPSIQKFTHRPRV